MGGGRRGSGRSPCAVNIRVLRRRLESHLKNTKHHQTPAEIIDHLHSSNPEYRRFKRVILAREIEPLLRQNPSYQDESGDPPLRSPCRKKLKKIDGNEDRLLHQENKHLRRRSMGVNGEPMADGSSTSSPSTNMSSDDEEDEEATDGALSDAVYGEKVEPEFDLIQWTLRRKYSEKKGVAAGESNLEEKNLEVEEASEQDKQINLLQTQRIEELEMGLKREVKGLRDGELKENNGPMFSDLGGMEGVLEQLKREVMVPLYCLELHQWLGVKPVSGILLHGPPGCGKTKLAHAIANETGVPFYQISATEVVSGVSGTSEENIRDLFSKAYRTAPSIVFIDEIDAIASKRENLQREMERRIVTQLMTCMDESHRLAKPADKDLNSERSDHKPGYVLVIGATNRPDAVDPALRRPGRFDREIGLGVPDEKARIEILSVVTRPLRLEGSFDLVKLARSTPGFVGADLHALATDAGYLAMQRIIDGRSKLITKWWQEKWMPEEMENLHITMNDFEVAAKKVQPSSLREGFSTIPNVKWEDVGGLDCLRQEFDRYIVRRIKHPEDYEKLGLDLETGFLLYGPPGCGKTLIAKALANEAGANFIHIKGPELLNKFVGESELAVRTLFRRARACPPCILFFDEVDALTTKREKEASGIGGGLLNQLLIELDGSEKCRGVFVIGATNRPDVIDPAFLRPGRFGKHLYIPLPNPHERGLILKALARKKPLDASVDLSAIGQMKACENLSGADLAALMNEAAMAALDEKLLTASSSSEAVPLTIKMVHFELTLEKVSPSVSDEDRKRYDRLSKSGI